MCVIYVLVYVMWTPPAGKDVDDQIHHIEVELNDCDDVVVVPEALCDHVCVEDNVPGPAQGKRDVRAKCAGGLQANGSDTKGRRARVWA